MIDKKTLDEKIPLVIYHGGCRDGFCAAWICKNGIERTGKVPEFFAGYYGQRPPVSEMLNRDVVIVDFSYPAALMREIAEAAASLLVLDHHKTAAADLAEFSKSPPSNTRVVFDMEQSGAGLAWRHYFGLEQTSPYLVRYVEDRDLWRHSLPESAAINAYIGTIPFAFEAWEYARLNVGIETAVTRGYAVQDKVKQYVAEVRKNAMRATFDGHNVPIVNAPQVDISELLHEMCSGETFAMGWWQRADGVFQYSLRSVGDFDVSILAKKHGGGGHKNAAGFESHRLLHP